MTTTTANNPETLPPLRDPTAFVKAMSRVASALAVDLVARAKDARIEPSLLESYADEKAAGRTGEDFLTWRNAFCDQVAASWVLCTVFVRTLEDRGFLRHRVAGPGAADRLAQFQRMFRFLSERDYLRQVFDALAEPPPSWPRDRPVDDWVGAQVFGRSSAPLWRLSPSAGALSAMLDALRAVDAEGMVLFTFGRPEGVEHDGSTTRFLGDLYQDLNEGVRKRYALLQTPDFVERFILDQTLTPALQERGIAVTVCDPTCGSGHFLLGAYDRLFEARTRQEPGRSVAERARQALSQVYGIDLNPYAAAIARFRLVLSMMDKAGLTALEQVPHDLVVHIYVDDALLAGRIGASQGVSQQFELGDISGGETAGFQRGLGFTLLDPRVNALLSSTRFDVVVGNPPYITEKDPKKRDLIRQAYPRSAAGKYALAAPFVERLFDLANAGGWMGQITANSFMKREFGSKLIEEFLPTVDLFEVIDTSGAYIPGHGTPTVLLFGRQRRPVMQTVQLVRGTRGEPSTPADPATGQVWSAISGHHGDVAFESPFITIGAIDREKLKQHPWSLGGGGAAEIKELLEERRAKRLEDLAASVGISAVTGEDDVFMRPARCFRGVSKVHQRRLVEGDQVRDWAIAPGDMVLFPYDSDLNLLPLSDVKGATAVLWPYRSVINKRKRFGVPMLQRGLTWYELQELYADKLRTPLSITFAFVATHNHFVLDRGDKVFKQSAPIIKLLDGSSEDDHLALLGYLNSSVACFWMKQVFYPKASAVGDLSTEKGNAEDNRYEFAATGLRPLPIPPLTKMVASLGARLDAASQRRRQNGDVKQWLDHDENSTSLGNFIDSICAQDEVAAGDLVALQEELDWAVYEAFGLAPDTNVTMHPAPITPEERPGSGGAAHPKRRALIDESAELRFLESPVYKRPWLGQRGVFGSNTFTFRDRVLQQLRDWLLDAAESELIKTRETAQPRSVRDLAQCLDKNPKSRAVAEVLASSSTYDLEALLGALMKGEAMASATSQVYTEEGLEKRRLWDETWARQRREDVGESVEIVTPPKYDRDDYFDANLVWRHRGKMDVPKERFIAYPTATPPAGASGVASLVFGWAGWTHLEQLQATIALWQDEWSEHGNKLVPRATRDALEALDPAAVADRAMREKLLPILQTMVDLLPWVRQWHNDDGETADQFDSYVEEQCRLLEMSRDDVHLWRIPARVRVTKKKASKKKATARAAAADE